MFGSGDFIGLLRVCPCLGAWHGMLCGEVFHSGAGWYTWLERVFLQMNDSESSFSGRGTSKSFTPYVLRSTTVSPQPGWFEGLAAIEAAEVN